MVGRQWLVLVVIVLILASTAPADALIDQSHGNAAAETVNVGGGQVDPDDIVLAVSLHTDGNATWRVEYRMRLATQNETDAFEDLAEDIRRDPDQYTSDFERQMQATARAAENATGRDMRIRNVTVSAEKRQLPQEYGVITYRFTWTNFAAVDGSRLRAGDALAQLFLDEETTLIVEWPTTYRTATVDPQPTDRRENAVIWEGPLEFTAGQPTLVVTTAGTRTPTTTQPAEPIASDLPLAVLASIALVILLCAGGVFYLRHKGRLGGTASDQAETEPRPATETGSEGEDPTEEGATTPPEELLSNEEQVLALLEEHGGRMKQQQIVQELDWTDAKTSQVIGDLREQDEIETFRIGRENVVRLAEESE